MDDTLTAAERDAEKFRAFLRALPPAQQTLDAVQYVDAHRRIVRLECVHCGRTWDLHGICGNRVGWTVAAANAHVRTCCHRRFEGADHGR